MLGDFDAIPAYDEYNRIQSESVFNEFTGDNDLVSSNMDQPMQELLSTLQFLPDSTIPDKQSPVNAIPIVEGFLGMQMPNSLLAEAHWEEVWVEICKNVLYWRKERNVCHGSHHLCTMNASSQPRCLQTGYVQRRGSEDCFLYP